MYVDTQVELSDAQAVTSTAISSNVIDTLTTSVGANAAAASASITTKPKVSVRLGKTKQSAVR